MENQTRFDLNAAVENWRNELAAQSNLASDDRRELETHLRDLISEFRRKGLNDEESFWLASKRVGQPKMIGEEFVKADSAKVWRERVLWMVAAILISWIWNIIYSSLFAIATASSHPSQNFQKISGVVFSLFYVLPIVVIMILIANGQLNRQSFLRSSFFRSRLRLGIVITVSVMTLSFIESTSSWWNLRLTGAIAESATIQIVVSELSEAIIPLVLVWLLVWLMPTQNRKTPKSA
jgi:hypothetical protein